MTIFWFLHYMILFTSDLLCSRVTCLKPDGVVLPSSVKVFGMCIESESLEEDSAVLDDSRTLGLDIATFINDFQVECFTSGGYARTFTHLNVL